MRLTEFMIVLMAVLIFLIPKMKKESNEIEAQEETTQEIVQELEDGNSFKIRFEVDNPADEAVADIIWIKKAAETTRDAGVSYFNIKTQTITKRFVKKFNQKLSVIEGVIELDNDPMSAEYDAQEIESLVLSEVEN